MSDTKIEMLYGNGKALALEFIKAYTEVQLDVEIKEESEDDVRVENSRAIRSRNNTRHGQNKRMFEKYRR